MEGVVVIHCNDRFREDIHAEIVGSRGTDVGRCDRAVGDMVHVELDRHCVGYVDGKIARIGAVLNGPFDDLEGICNGSYDFCCLYWDLNISNECRRLIFILRLDHNVRERARLGMAKRIHDIIGSSDIYVGDYGGQYKVHYAVAKTSRHSPSTSVASLSHSKRLGTISLFSLSDPVGSDPSSAFPTCSSEAARVMGFDTVVEASEAVATEPGTEAESEWSGDGVFGMAIAGYDDLLEADGKEVGAGFDRQSWMVASSGGVSRASGTREEIPKDLKDGS